MSRVDDAKGVRLEDQQVALTSYLSALLQEVPEYRQPENAEPDASPAPVLVHAPTEVAAPTPVESVCAAGAPLPQLESSAPGADVPDWARERFQCLVFRVAGLSLAVPLAKLSGVIPWPDSVTPMPNRSELFLGLLRHQQRNVKIVDTALMVLPENRQAEALPPAAERLAHIILLDEGRWGLACDGIGEVLTLDRDEVRWRSAQGRRPWLAGTVLKHLCALLDVDAFVELLLHGERGQ